MRTFALSFLLLAACTREVPDDGVHAPACDTSIVATDPVDGATDAYWRQAISFSLDAPDPEAVVVADVPGEQLVSDDGLTVSFQPDAPLTPQTGYTVALDFCRGTPEIAFSTSPLGLPIEDEAALEGRTFQLDLQAAAFPAGEGLAEVAATLVTPRLLVSVASAEGDSLALTVAIPEEDDDEAQDFCVRTVDLPVADFSTAPYFTLSAADIDFGAESTTVALRQMDFTGTLSPDASWMGGGTFSAVLDARDVVALLEASSPDTMCAIAESLNVPCQACPHDGEPWCVTLDVVDLEATWLPGVVVEPVEEPGADPRCGSVGG